VKKFIKPARGKMLIGGCAALAAIAIGYILLTAPRPAPGQPETPAQTRSHTAYSAFSKATSSFAASVRSCQAPARQLPCLKAADNQLAEAFTRLARNIGSIPVTGSAKYAAADLGEAAEQAAHSLQPLRAVRTLPQYRQAWATLSLPLDDIQVIHDYGYLHYTLSSESASAGQSGSTVAGTQAHPDVTGIALAGDNYDHGAVVYRALQQLTQRCMSGQGFPYHRDSWEAAPAQTDAPLYVDVTALRRDGYGLYQVVTAAQEKKPQSSPPDPNASYLKSLTTAQRQRWNKALVSGPELAVTIPDGGQPTFQPGGCYAKSYGQLYGSYQKWTAVEAYATDLEAKVKTEALWSKVWLAAQARWARCLAQAGFAYPTEADAVHAVTTRYQTSGGKLSRVHQLELRIARQDAACTGSVRLNQAGRAAIGAAAATLPADQLSALATWQTMQARAYAAANQVLAAP
jgi:hypothetical protein